MIKPAFRDAHPEVYFDNAATTKVSPMVIEAMRPYLEESYGNPETLYHLGRRAKEGVEKARAEVAELLHCRPERVFFTSGGTESNNWALKSACDGGGVLAVSAIEHASVLEPAAFLERKGKVSQRTVWVDGKGRVDMEALQSILEHGKVAMVSIQHANNEVGTVQDLAAISAMARSAGAVFHSDAVQTLGKMDIFVEDLGVDMLSVSAHKLHGPMGVGALYVREGIALDPMMHGGGQEGGMRSGTVAVHQVVGFGAAAEAARCSLGSFRVSATRWCKELEAELAAKVGARRNGDAEKGLCNVLSFTVPGVEATLLASVLDEQFGLCVACGAACSRGKPSHVLRAMGLSDTDVRQTIRVSTGRMTSDKDVRKLWQSIQAAVRMAKERDLV